MAVVLATAVGGCAVPGWPSTDAGTVSADADAKEGAGREWHYYAEGQRVKPEDPHGAPAEEPEPPPTAHEPPEIHHPVEPRYCVNWLRPNAVERLDVTPGAGSATITWPNTVNPRLRTYRVTIVPQQLPGGDRAPFASREVKPVDDCGDVSVGIDGLDSGRRYVFWLTAVVDVGAGGVREPMIARSPVVTVT